MPPPARHLQRLDALSRSQLHRTLSQSPRFVHSSSPLNVTASHEQSTSQIPSQLYSPSTSTPAPSRPKPSPTPLARLPTSSIFRSYAITGLSSSPALLTLCFKVLQRMLDSKSYLLSLERNPVLAKLLKSTFYAQFCAGETKKEVTVNTAAARDALGYDGIILEYALEVVGGEGAAPTAEEIAADIKTWREGMLASIEVAREGDFIGLKWSGLGPHALHLLKTRQPATPEMWSAINAACEAAAAKNVCLLPSAEEESSNPGSEAWTLALQKKYNTPEQGRAVLYTTYQCYLKSTRLAQHLAQAQKEGYIAGVKLVRGAYLNSEPRHLIWETREGTDKCYDACAEAVLKQEWNSTVSCPNTPATPFPAVNIVLATHNLVSVQKAQAIRAAQLASRPASELPRLTYAQLQGMADEISQELVQDPAKIADVKSKVVKCMTWGTTTQCLNYLMRRASENKEAAMRTSDTRKAMGRELFRRFKAGVGFS